MQELKLEQKQSKKLKMTAELKQAIGLLQYTSNELTEYIKEEALNNPLIELEEYPLTNRRETYNIKTEKSDYTTIDYIDGSKETLYDYLKSQVSFLKLSSNKQRIINYILLMLDKNGYFQSDFNDVASHLNISLNEVQSCLKIVQSLEPYGIGARNLQECLLLQLSTSHPKNNSAKQIVLSYLNELAQQDYSFIAKELNITLAEVSKAVNLIKSLNPRPADEFDDQDSVNYIIPDLYIEVENESISIEVNDSYLPKIKVSTEYKELTDSLVDKETIKYLETKYKEAIWLKRSVAHRHATLLKITDAIVKRQSNFFLTSEGDLQPLKLEDISKVCDVHISTVSRSTKNKYVQTSFGLFELKDFFATSIKTKNGQTKSSQSVKKMIKMLIDKEDKAHPQSDQDIANFLKEKDIVISRRTVAKYRSNLNIPSSKNRLRSNV